jgi:hypothetical protein
MAAVVLSVLIIGLVLTLSFLGLTIAMCFLDGTKDNDPRRTYK